MPDALLIRMSMPCSAPAAFVTKRAGAESSPRSHGMLKTVPPCRFSSASAASSPCALRAQIATSAPSAANARAIDRPIPRLPPATTTFLPLKEICIAQPRVKLTLDILKRADSILNESSLGRERSLRKADPRQLMLVVMQMHQAAAGNRGESGRGGMIGLTLEFHRADEVAHQPRIQPTLDQLQQLSGIADDIAAQPIHPADVPRFQSEGA